MSSVKSHTFQEAAHLAQTPNTPRRQLCGQQGADHNNISPDFWDRQEEEIRAMGYEHFEGHRNPLDMQRGAEHATLIQRR